MLTKTEPRFNNDTAGNMRRIVQYAELAGWRWSQADNEQVYVLAPRELRDDIPVMAMKLPQATCTTAWSGGDGFAARWQIAS